MTRSSSPSIPMQKSLVPPTRSSVPNFVISNLRDTGRRMTNRGVFEFDITTGVFTWANDYALSILGYNQSQLGSLTIFDIVQEEFHDIVRSNLNDGSKFKFYIWPSKMINGDIAWWYISQTQIHHPLQWSHGDLIQKTDSSGVAFSFMKTQMETTNNYSQIQNQLNELDEWVKEQIKNLSEEDKALWEFTKNIEEKISNVVEASTHAANVSSSTRKEVEKLGSIMIEQYKSFDEKFASHTTEIIKLMNSDESHNERIEAFEKHIKNITDLAIKAVTVQAERIGKGISKQIAIPVAGITALATAIQWITQHWSDIVRIFTKMF